jgi:hypothetical protein
MWRQVLRQILILHQVHSRLDCVHRSKACSDAGVASGSRFESDESEDSAFVS